MQDRSKPVRLLERRFIVRVPLEKAWSHLERIEKWPSWARHIRRIQLSPQGPLGLDSLGVIQLTNGIRSKFRLVKLNPGSDWKWDGPILWLSVGYDHQFKRISPDATEIGFTIDGAGFGARTLGRIFAWVYARNLDRAIPNLIKEIEDADPEV
jgi:hypothetical protein